MASTFKRPSPEVAAALEAASKATGIDPCLLRAIAYIESRFNPAAVGPEVKAGWKAMGLMQLGPAARQGIADPLDASANAMGGAKLLAGYLRRYQNDVPFALAAYNWGPSRVDKKGKWPEEVNRYVDGVLERAALERAERARGAERLPLQAAKDLAAFLTSTQRYGSKDGDRAAEVRAAQRDLGVEPDGIVGPRTRDAARRHGVELPQKNDGGVA